MFFALLTFTFAIAFLVFDLLFYRRCLNRGVQMHKYGRLIPGSGLYYTWKQGG